MDAVYEAIKNLLKAVINLFAAVIDLFVRLINGLSSIVSKINFQSARKAKDDLEIKAGEDSGKKEDSELVDAIRCELKKKITNRDAYIMVKAEAEVFANSHVKKFFQGRRRRLENAIIRILLEEEFSGAFPEEEKIHVICEVNKEAIS